jgi:5-hydroxyisourate hydrolase-like protein (transthyretin family)
MKQTITLAADKIKVSGPKVDGGYSLTFEVGEYMQEAVAKLLMVKQNTVVMVNVEVEDYGGEPTDQ